MFERYRELLEHAVETFIFGCRWLLAPLYVGLGLAVIVLVVKFAEEFLHIAMKPLAVSDAAIILGVLSLVDLTLTASLLIIVIFSGYENFVSKIDHAGHRDWPEWMGTIDFTALKLKLLSSIVAISAVQLLKQFMDLSKVSDRDIMWSVIIHVVFVVSSVLLALSDRISEGRGGHAVAAPAPSQRPAAEPAGSAEANPTS